MLFLLSICLFFFPFFVCRSCSIWQWSRPAILRLRFTSVLSRKSETRIPSISVCVPERGLVFDIQLSWSTVHDPWIYIRGMKNCSCKEQISNHMVGRTSYHWCRRSEWTVCCDHSRQRASIGLSWGPFCLHTSHFHLILLIGPSSPLSFFLFLSEAFEETMIKPQSEAIPEKVMLVMAEHSTQWQKTYVILKMSQKITLVLSSFSERFLNVWL